MRDKKNLQEFHNYKEFKSDSAPTGHQRGRSQIAQTDTIYQLSMEEMGWSNK